MLRSKYDIPEINDWIDKNIDSSNKKYELIDKLLECFSNLVPFDISEEECL
jgi:hypothetical protein